MANSIDLAMVVPRTQVARLEWSPGARSVVRPASVTETANSRQYEGGAAVAGESAVDRAAMATAATQVQDAVDNIHGMQSQLAGYHSSLMGSWQGEASNAFTMA